MAQKCSYCFFNVSVSVKMKISKKVAFQINIYIQSYLIYYTFTHNLQNKHILLNIVLKIH